MPPVGEGTAVNTRPPAAPPGDDCTLILNLMDPVRSIPLAADLSSSEPSGIFKVLWLSDCDSPLGSVVTL